MGAMLCFEIARYLRRQRFKGPVKMFVSARRAPQVPDDDPPTYNLPDKEFLEELRRIKGTPAEVLEHEELLAMFVPIIRADFEACQTYEYKPEPPLDCPITAFGGVTDDEETRERIEQWGEQTTRSFSLSMLPGDHFFIHTSEELLVRTLGQDLSRVVAGLV
jgi:medium-chain acyl-[acyl-carrier-protein] hydrolase